MNLCIDSRKVQEGDMFFCIDGSALDGHDFAEQAVDNGAKVIIYEHDMPMKDREGVIYIKVPSTLDALNEAAASLNGWPSNHLTMFGVTGTNGKSSISYLISKIYTKYKGECGYLGTIGGLIRLFFCSQASRHICFRCCHRTDIVGIHQNFQYIR